MCKNKSNQVKVSNIVLNGIFSIVGLVYDDLHKQLSVNSLIDAA